MKNKAILVSFIAIFALVFALSSVVALDIDIDEVRVNDLVASTTEPTVAGTVSNTVPIEVRFTAKEYAEDIRVKVEIKGYKEDIEAETSRKLVFEGRKYVERFSLQLPSSVDLDTRNEDIILYVEIFNDEGIVRKTYIISMQRELYNLRIISVEAPQRITAGSIVALDVVLENNGYERLDNTYVKASIPELAVERRIYFGDLESIQEDTYDDIRDTVNKRIYLSIPRNSVPGVYNIQLEAYNYDAVSKATKPIIVTAAETGVLPTSTSKTIGVGGQAIFDVVLVNPNDRMVVYTLTPEESTGLIVEISKPIVTVAADSSENVEVKVRATKSVEEGTHLVTINVNSENGLVKQIHFSVNVEKGVGDSTVILTIVLAIIFIVLLIILLVLLTKKPVETEEFGETSYY